MPHVWLSAEAAENFLANNLVGRLATCDSEGQPYITPLNYVYQHGKIYFHCAKKGHRLDNLTVNPRVCFEVSQVDQLVISPSACSSSTRYTSVVVFGSTSIITGQQEKADILNALMTSHAKGAPYHPVTTEMADSCTVVAISIDRLSGKRNINPGETQPE